MMIRESSTKIVNFMTPGAGVLVIGFGHIGHKCRLAVDRRYTDLNEYGKQCAASDNNRACCGQTVHRSE